ncbi:MAG: AsmA family protein, partial [Burkholderiaceae bacterium]|nr:AsmA family protein [Burkholderiaceae bacterium]
MINSSSRPVLFKRILVGVLALLAVLVLVIAFFPWDAMRGPINRYVSDQLGRRFEITRHLSVDLGRTVT